MPKQRLEAVLLAIGLTLPTLITLWYFVWAAGSPAAVQKTAYAIGKVVQFALPVVWLLVIHRAWPQWRPLRSDLVAFSALFGLVIGGAAVTLFFVWLKPSGLINPAIELIRQKTAGFEFTTRTQIIAIGVFYSLFHSLLEEYYWRWFIFGRLRNHLPLGAAIAVSSLGFMAHHVVVLVCYLGAASPFTYLASASVAVGGAVWAWTFHRSRSLLGPWLGHLLIDAAIFVIYYDLVAGALPS